MQQFLKAIIVMLICTPFAFGGIAPGSLSAPLPIHNNTHYALQVGTTVSAQIVNATDLPAGTTTVPVWVKSSVLGNTLLVGSVSGTTISFIYTAPANGCQTTIVAYGSTGNNANNGIITPGGSSAAGFAFTNVNGIVQECFSINCPENLEATGGTLTCSNLATVQLFASTGDPNSTYSWSGPGIVSGGNTATPIVNRVGTYTVTASTPNCPTLSTSVEVTVEPVECTTLVNSSCYSSSSDVCEGDSVTFSANGSGPGAPFTYSWSGPHGFSSTNASITLSNVTLVDGGEYIVTVRDANGFYSYCSSTIAVHSAPTLSGCPEDTSYQCIRDVPPPANVTASDDQGSVTVEFSETQSNNGSNCNNVITRTWTATNSCGSVSCTQVIYVNDTTAPTFTFVPEGGTIECPATPVFGDANATDGCSDVIITYNDVTTPGNCAGSYSVTRTWTATDACSNSATASATIYVVDTTPPSFTFVPEDHTIECPATPAFGEPEASDACSDVTISYNDETTAGTCAGSYSVTRTWTATDACGNSSTASTTITVEDHTAPTISCPENIVVNTTNNECGAVVNFEISANDECSGIIIVATPPSGSTFSFGTTTVNVTATDACGNSSSCNFTVTVLSSISGMKFYDSNSNGVKEEGEVGIAGWKITLNGPDNLSMTQFTANDGNYSFNRLASGSYTVCEVLPANPGWSNITPLCQTIELTCNAVVNFGNTYSATPGGHTMGFWQNKNGEKLVTSADLTALRTFCLRNANGTNFDPTSYSQLKTWLKGANATNMAYMLSAQMTATYLGVMHGFTNPLVLVDGNRNVTDLIAYANALLCADGHTPSGDSNRAEQTRVKDILDNINNGRSFMQPAPGPVTYSIGSTQQVSEIGSEEVDGSQRPLPNEYQLFENYPNPFNPTTTFVYALPEDAYVTLKVYDILGREVATHVNRVQQAGYYNEIFNASSLSSGVYIYRFNAGNYSAVKKFALMK